MRTELNFRFNRLLPPATESGLLRLSKRESELKSRTLLKSVKLDFVRKNLEILANVYEAAVKPGCRTEKRVVNINFIVISDARRLAQPVGCSRTVVTDQPAVTVNPPSGMSL